MKTANYTHRDTARGPYSVATPRNLVSVRDLIRVGSDAGLHVTGDRIHHAIRCGELLPESNVPPAMFTVDAANAWLSRLTWSESW